MNNRLFEEINRFKLLSGYDTKKTLSEQVELLSEQDKNWSVWSYNGEPIWMEGPNKEFVPTAKGTELGYTSKENANLAFMKASEEEKASFRREPYNKKTHQQYFNLSQGVPSNAQLKKEQESTETPKLTGDNVKMGQINFNGTEGVAKFVNGKLFGNLPSNSRLIIGKIQILESFTVPVGAVPITIKGTDVTPPTYKTVSISFGDATMTDPFVVGKSEMKPEAKAKVDEYIKNVLDFKTQNGDEAYQKYIEFLNSKKPIGVNGYASRDGDPNKVYKSGKTAAQADLELSQQRADVIANYIVSKLPELKGIIVGVGKGQTTEFGGEESGWPAPDKTKYGTNRRFVIEIPNFSYDKTVLDAAGYSTDWEKQGMDNSGVRPNVKTDGKITNMGTARSAHQSVPTEFASKKEIDVAQQVYETDLGSLVPGLKGVKLQHYKDPNGYFIVTKEQLKTLEKYIPIMDGSSMNGIPNPTITLTSKSLTLEANGASYMWNGWYPATASVNSGNDFNFITDYRLAAIKYQDSNGQITPAGYLLGRFGFGIKEQNLE